MFRRDKRLVTAFIIRNGVREIQFLPKLAWAAVAHCVTSSSIADMDPADLRDAFRCASAVLMPSTSIISQPTLIILSIYGLHTPGIIAISRTRPVVVPGVRTRASRLLPSLWRSRSLVVVERFIDLPGGRLSRCHHAVIAESPPILPRFARQPSAGLYLQ